MNVDSSLCQALDDFSASGADRFPDALATSLKSARFFSLLLPAHLGGEPPALPDYLHLVRTIARANGSAGWCVNQGSVLASLARLLPVDAGRTIYKNASVTVANGPPRQCESVPTDGGFRLTGRWHFSSGIESADWLIGVAPVRENGKVVDTLWHYFPKSEATIGTDWPVQGLRATCSYEFAVDDLFIPSDRAVRAVVMDDDEPLYQVPLNLLFASGFAAVALGVAEAAIEFARERVQEKVKRFERNAMKEDTLVQDRLGHALARWRAAESYLMRTVEHAWAETNRAGTCDMDHRMALRLATTHVIHEARGAADIAYDLCSTDSIFNSTPVQQRFQDIHVITQHLQGRPEVYSVVGRHELGLPVKSPLI